MSGKPNEREFQFKMTGKTVYANFADIVSVAIPDDEIPLILKELADINWIVDRTQKKT